MIPLLSAAWLLTVKPASAQYPQGWQCPGGGTCPPPGNTGYPGGNTGYPGSTDGSNTGYTGIVGGTNSGYPGNNNGTGTGYPGSTGGGTGTGYPGSTGGNNTGYPGGGTNGTGYPGSTGGSNTGYPGSTGGNNSGSSTGYPGGGTNGSGSGTGYPGGNTGGTGSGNTGGTGTGGSGTGYPGGGTGTGYPGGGTGTGTGGTGTGTGGGTITPGHWDVSYSSTGTTSWDYPGYDSASSNIVAQSGSSQWPATGSGDGVYSSYYLDASTTGTVTATLAWVPTTGQDATSDPPSSSVIVVESGSASEWGGGPGTGSADDGWGDTSSQGGYPGSSSGGGGYPGSASSSGTHYEVKDGTSGTITLTKTLSASTPKNTTPDASGNFAAVGAMVSVGLNVLPPPPATITLKGPITVNGTQEALTGQPVTATFNCGLPSGTTITNYKWDIESQEGASLVGGYFTSQPLGKTLSVTGLNDPSSSSITFYDGIKDNVTINATVTVKLPDNTTGTVKATTQIGFVKPTVTAPIPFQQTEYDNFAQHGNDTSSALGAYEQWAGVRITMPDGFSSGTGCFAQILNSDARTDTRHMGGTYTQKVQISDGTWAAIPTPCLDTGFPYPYATPWQVSGTGSGYDQPSFFVAPPLNAGDAGRNDWYHASGEDHFTTWVMFTPNNADPSFIWVPLGSFDWDWSNTADLNVNSLPPGWIANPPGGHHGTLAANDNWPTWTNFTPSGALAMHQ